jgi:predicted  nucleic acid-binding Zn-ribbon protein
VEGIMDVEDRREFTQLDQRITAIGGKMDGIRLDVAQLDKSEEGCRREINAEIRGGEKRMDSHRDDIAALKIDVVDVRKSISDLANIDGKQEEHLRSTDANVLKLEKGFALVADKVENLGKAHAKNLGGIAVLMVVLGILEIAVPYLLHWK